METRGEGRKKALGESRKAGKLLFKTQMTEIKLGLAVCSVHDPLTGIRTLAGFILFRFFRRC